MLAGCDQVFGLDGRRPPGEEPTGLCGDKFGDERYVVQPTPARWLTAETECEKLDDPDDDWFSHLAVLTDRFEIAAFELPVGTDAWTGLVSPDRAEFLWVTSEVTGPFPFAPGKPNSTSTDRCGAARESELALDDTGCGTPRPYVCECDQFPALPTRYVGI